MLRVTNSPQTGNIRNLAGGFCQMMKAVFRSLAVKLWPTCVRADHTRRAMRLYSKGDFSGAYAAFSGAVQRWPELLQIGDVCVMLAHLECFVKHNPRAALALLENARDMRVRMVDLYYLVRAQSLWHLGESTAALDCFERSITAERSVFNLMEFATFLTQTDPMRAAAILEEILERDPRNCRAWVYMGFNAARAKDADKARALIRKAEELYPGANELYEIGRLYNELCDFSAAVRAYLKAGERGFWHRAELNEGLAESYMGLGDTEAARNYVRAALQHDPNNERGNELWRDLQRGQLTDDRDDSVLH